MSTTDHTSRPIGELDLQDHRWARVDIGDLGGADPHRVLVGSVDPEIGRGHADPAGKVGDLIGTYWAALFLISRAFVKLLTVAGLTGWRITPVLWRAIPQSLTCLSCKLWGHVVPYGKLEQAEF